MKKNISIALVVLVVVVFGVYAYRHWGSARMTQLPNGSVAQNVTPVPVSAQNPYAMATGTYPQFANASAEFNAQISTAIDTAVAAHLKDSAENYKARYETATPDEHVTPTPKAEDRFPLSIASQIVRNDDRVISVLVTIDEYTGGAHGQHIMMTFNYDVVAGKEITLTDLARGDVQFLKKLSTVSRKMLLTQLATAAQVQPSDIDQEMLNDGTTPTAENFSLFTIPNDTQVTFYFGEYQVAAYVFGPQQITVDIPLKTL